MITRNKFTEFVSIMRGDRKNWMRIGSKFTKLDVKSNSRFSIK